MSNGRMGIADTKIARSALDDRPTSLRIIFGGPLSYDQWKAGGDNRVALSFSNYGYNAVFEMINNPATNVGVLSVKINNSSVPAGDWVLRQHDELLCYRPMDLTLRDLIDELGRRQMDIMLFLKVNGTPSGSRYWVTKALEVLAKEDRNFGREYRRQQNFIADALETVYLNGEESNPEARLEPNSPPGVFNYIASLSAEEMAPRILDCSTDIFTLLVRSSRDKLGWQAPSACSALEGQWFAQLPDDVKGRIVDELFDYWLRHKIFGPALDMLATMCCGDEVSGVPVIKPKIEGQMAARFPQASRALQHVHSTPSRLEKFALCCVAIICLRDDVGASDS